ncbi:hypothetical protein [Pseudomonas sp. BF-RE-26]|uniref:hypothetical protein n=1 Tax=Pseudomonas sp. BF-RE-26 TaxID=2832396 RepID=UPI001CBEBD80|nr:hypothetical protein [Pseudomonas sp. BF-RE-26]
MNTRQLGINPIFPPRERVYPGDLYIAPFYRDLDQSKVSPLYFTITAQRFDHVDMSFALDEEQLIDTLPEMQDYTDDSGKVITPWTLNPYPGSKGRRGGRQISGGRINGLVAFPGFTFASLSESDIGVNITNGAWGALFGGGRKARYSVSYSVPAAEYISIPLKTAMETFRAYVAGLSVGAKDDIKLISKSMSSQETSDVITVMILPTEVFYARAIDITVSADDALSANLSAVTMAMVELSAEKTKLQSQLLKLRGINSSMPSVKEEGEVINTEEAKEAGNKGAKDKESAQPSNQKQISALESQIENIQSQIDNTSRSVIPSVPGVTGSVTRASAYGVTLRQVFQYPIAIGYRGLSFLTDDIIANKISPRSPNGTLYFRGKLDDERFDQLFHNESAKKIN